MAARTVAALDTHLVIVGLSRYLRVFDPGIFEPTAQSDDEPTDRHDAMTGVKSGDVLECEVGRYLVRARGSDRGVRSSRCSSRSRPSNTTLPRGDGRVSPPVQFQASDRRPRRSAAGSGAAAPRLRDRTGARRRSRQGYATPADARAFLQMARQPQHANFYQPDRHGLLSRGRRRSRKKRSDMRPHTRRVTETLSARLRNDIPTSIDAFIDLLAEAGVMPARPRALLEAADQDTHRSKNSRS